MLHDPDGVCAIYLKHGEDLVEMVRSRTRQRRSCSSCSPTTRTSSAATGTPRPASAGCSSNARSGSPRPEDAGGRWSVDHLFLDEAAVPTLVEVKRSTDTRIRREVVGQMLDYAANASSYWALDGIKSAFESRYEDAEGAERAVLELLGGDTDAAAGFWERVGVNLQARRLRLVFVADEIPSELRRVIEFLNEQMSTTEVLGLEVRQFVERGGTRQTLVPQLIGARGARGVTLSGVSRSSRPSPAG
jgi:hypothetical protein